MDARNTGTLIRALREERGLTQRQLADTLGVTDKAVSKRLSFQGGMALLPGVFHPSLEHLLHGIVAQPYRLNNMEMQIDGFPLRDRCFHVL